jgi:hypothetical protein
MAPTLATACAALPPEGALLAWGGPALRRLACVLDNPGFVREPAGGALSSAAVPRAGLWPAAPPLCRCVKCTTNRFLTAWRVLYGNGRLCSCLVSRPRSLIASLPCSQPWRLACTAQRHKGGARRAGDSCGAVHAKCQGVHSTRVRSPGFDSNTTISREKLQRI